MNVRLVGVLLFKEFFQGPKNFIFIFALVAPIVMSLVVSLVFGTLFAHQATLGIVDEGDSQLVTLVEASPSVTSKVYNRVSELEEAVAEGAVDSGLVLPENFDRSVQQVERVTIPIYVWGESLARDRTVIAVTVANLVRELAGQEAPVEITSITLGDEASIPWSDRVLPFIVLVTVFIAGFALPATSLLYEKEKKTINALAVTPASMVDIFWAKGLLGVIVSVFMGIVILALNQAFGTQPGLLVMLLFLGSVMAAGLGLAAGSIVKNITTFFASMKLLGIFLYAPAFVYMFPEIPQWIGKVFPAYYFVEPIVELSQQGGGWPEIATNVFVLVGLDLALIALVAFILSRKPQYAG
ncbi:MAG: ABC transporter permease [Dehalococcoidia bacterium]